MAKAGASPDPAAHGTRAMPRPGPEERRHPRDPDFVILAAQRTGSTMLVSRLASHPDLTCLGEIYVRDAETRQSALAPLPRAIRDDFSSSETCERHWRDFLDRVAGARTGRWGFKLMANQCADVRRYLIGDTAAKLIVLSRGNPLAVFASNRIAYAARAAGGPVASVPFDEERFRRFLANYERNFARIHDEIAGAGRDHLATTYERLRGAEGAAEDARILDFLGAAPHPLASATRKRNSDDILGRFDDPAGVRACLERIGRPDWATDRAGEDGAGPVPRP